jgi:hypothetical protein
LYNNDGYWNKKLKSTFINNVINGRFRCLIYGIRATTDTIGRSKRKMIKNGDSKSMQPLIKRLFQENDGINLKMTYIIKLFF